MRARIAFLFSLILVANVAFAKEVFLSVGGSANSFFTDARIFNPNDKEITIQAYYLPRGNIDNASEAPTEIKLAPRQMRIFDNVVQTLLTRSDVGAIRLVSADDFAASQRIYSLSTSACGGFAPTCTLGQFVQGLDITSALNRGVLIGLKVVQGQYRTNVGAVNPNNTEARVTWRLYDRTNTLISVSEPMVMPPFGVIGPTQSNSTFFVPTPGGDLSDFWMTFNSDKPIFVYASVLDNATNDGTLIPAANDPGTDPPVAQPRVVTVTAVDFSFSVDAPPDIHAGETVKFRVIGSQGVHGFALFTPVGDPVFSSPSLTPTGVEHTIKLPNVSGDYVFFCTNTSCGTGHTEMHGTLPVSAAHSH